MIALFRLKLVAKVDKYPSTGRTLQLWIRAIDFERIAVQSRCDANFASCECLPSEPPHCNDSLTADELNTKLEAVGGFLFMCMTYWFAG